MKKNQINKIIFFIPSVILIIIFVTFLDKITKDESTLNNFTPKIAELSKVSKDNIVTLEVQNKKYSHEVIKGDSVYILMEKIKNDPENNFSFSGKNYSFGYFIEEINGIKNTTGLYWIYYVNGIEASVGISDFILKDGDTIKWIQK